VRKKKKLPLTPLRLLLALLRKPLLLLPQPLRTLLRLLLPLLRPLLTLLRLLPLPLRTLLRSNRVFGFDAKNAAFGRLFCFRLILRDSGVFNRSNGWHEDLQK
jgi:hypothetical protein